MAIDCKIMVMAGRSFLAMIRYVLLNVNNTPINSTIIFAMSIITFLCCATVDGSTY